MINGKQKGKHKWRERHNRETVIRRAKELADTKKPWVLCIDPDERTAFRKPISYS